MSKRLVKIAKELNVGTATIVEHLTKSGYDIDNKPTAKVSDEMYAELLKEFQKSIAIKEKADQLIIGTRPNGAKEELKADLTMVEAVPSPPPPQSKPAEVNEPAEKVEEKENKVE